MNEAALAPAGSSARHAGRLRRWLLGGAAVGLLGLLAIGRNSPSGATVNASAHSPLQLKALQQGVLRVAVRSYPRPSLPNAPLPPEPDVLDLAYAQWLADQLDVALQLGAPDTADLLVQGHARSLQPMSLVSGSGYGEQTFQLVVLRQQLPRWQAWAPQPWLDALTNFWPGLRAASSSSTRPTVCVGEGSVPLEPLEALGWNPRPARSAIHAISNFLAGQCDALAEATSVTDKLLQQGTWRFYAPMGSSWSWQGADDSLPTLTSDPWLQHMQQRWQASAARVQALRNRTSTLLLEASMLEDGAICH